MMSFFGDATDYTKLSKSTPGFFCLHVPGHPAMLGWDANKYKELAIFRQPLFFSKCRGYSP
jgi:hypothetical protein